jgi:hypothetical protein
MRYFNIVGFLSIFILIGCKNKISKSDYYNSDEYLIYQIKNATNKIEIEYNDLPPNTIANIEISYSSYVFLSEMYASGLGYELTINDVNTDESLFKKIYFNLDGRKLESKKDEGKTDCFYLVYPVTFIMPDGSNVIVESDSEGDWEELKNWYDDNPNSEDWPDLQYPVDIILEDGTTTIINNEEEMNSIKVSCQ